MASITPNQSLPYPVSTDSPDVPRDIKALAEAIEKKLVMVFTDSATRSTKVPSPTAGMFSVLTSTGAVEYYNGSAWTKIYPSTGPAFSRGTTVPANSSGADGDVFFKIG